LLTIVERLSEKRRQGDGQKRGDPLLMWQPDDPGCRLPGMHRLEELEKRWHPQADFFGQLAANPALDGWARGRERVRVRIGEGGDARGVLVTQVKGGQAKRTTLLCSLIADTPEIKKRSRT
jgi:hypothetical protein